MSYKTVLAYIRSEAELQRILPALELINEKLSDLHIIGLYSIPAVAVYADMNGFIDPGMFEIHEKHHEKNSNKIKQLFLAAIQKQTNSYDFQIIHSENGTGAQGATQIASGADLIITGRTDPDDPDIANDPIDTLIFDSGRPVLIVPFSPLRKLDKVAIAYNGKREGARAALDALPLLKSAEKVELVWIDPPLDEHGQAVIPQALELAKALSRHGVNISIQSLTTSKRSAVETLHEYLEATQVDMLVMGAYSHSRLRELVFGGMTKSVLANISTLTLFSR